MTADDSAPNTGTMNTANSNTTNSRGMIREAIAPSTTVMTTPEELEAELKTADKNRSLKAQSVTSSRETPP